MLQYVVSLSGSAAEIGVCQSSKFNCERVPTTFDNILTQQRGDLAMQQSTGSGTVTNSLEGGVQDGQALDITVLGLNSGTSMVRITCSVGILSRKLTLKLGWHRLRSLPVQTANTLGPSPFRAAQVWRDSAGADDQEACLEHDPAQPHESRGDRRGERHSG